MNQTILHNQHKKLGARIVDFHGWALPVQYQGVIAEHKHTRSAASLFDTSHMGLFLFTGPRAATQLNRVGSQNAEKLATNRARYGFLLNENAGIIDDTILMRLDDEEFLLVVNAGPSGGDLEWIEQHTSGDFTIRNLSNEGYGKIDLQGPLSHEILAPHLDREITDMKFFGVTRINCCDRPCILGRTGYTGELGYEIMAAGEDLKRIFETLISDDRVEPAGLGARDSLRLEVGLPLYGNELSQKHTPLEADLMMFAPDDHEYIGLAALREQKEQGPPQKLVMLRAETRRRAAESDTINHDGTPVGNITSSAFSPSMETSIAMGYVKPDIANQGNTVQVQTRRAEIEMTICEKPLYKDGTCRVKL